MTTLTLTTVIHASIGICFDLARSIDLHKESMLQSNEKAVGGRMTGLIEEGEFVTWEAIHFFVRQRLTSKITKMEIPFYFKDVMIEGAFVSMEHEHYFQSIKGVTTMTDQFYYKVPFGLIGKVFDFFILKKYMIKILTIRNEAIRKSAEKFISS